MNNLPIYNNNPQSLTKGMQGDSTQPRNGTTSASGNVAHISQANSSTTDQATEAFSVLLAKQISEAGLPAPDTMQISMSIHGKAIPGDAAPTAKDAQDQTTITNPSNDSTNSLAAVLLQIPIQQTDAPSKDIVGAGREANGIKQKIEDGFQRAADKSGGAGNSLQKADNSQLADFSTHIPLSSDAVKHVEMPVHSTNQSQASQNNSKVISSSTSAVMSNIVISNTSSDTTQTIATPLGNSGWADEFSQKIVWMSTQQNQTAELHLNPPDLGPLNVMLKMSDNQLTAQFTSPHSAVRDAVENSLPKLREILADNNITLGNATVSDQAPRDRGSEGFSNQDSGTAKQREVSLITIGSPDISPITTQNVSARRHNGMLDIFA